MTCLRRFSPILVGAALAACGSLPPPERGPVPTPVPAPAERPPAPWSAAPLDASAVPSEFLRSWRAADNRSTCALVAPAAIPDPRNATPRIATFSGGWAVAYDLPGTRSAFGVAGTGTTPSPDQYDGWPHRIRWADGSRAGYGPEGGTGPQQLAYLEIAGQGCLYNVWSKLGTAHLEALLGALRFVRTGEG